MGPENKLSDPTGNCESGILKSSTRTFRQIKRELEEKDVAARYTLTADKLYVGQLPCYVWEQNRENTQIRVQYGFGGDPTLF